MKLKKKLSISSLLRFLSSRSSRPVYCALGQNFNLRFNFNNNPGSGENSLSENLYSP